MHPHTPHARHEGERATNSITQFGGDPIPRLPPNARPREVRRTFLLEPRAVAAVRRWLVAALTTRGGLRPQQVGDLTEAALEMIHRLASSQPHTRTIDISIFDQGGDVGVRMGSGGAHGSQLVLLQRSIGGP